MNEEQIRENAMSYVAVACHDEVFLGYMRAAFIAGAHSMELTIRDLEYEIKKLKIELESRS